MSRCTIILHLALIKLIFLCLMHGRTEDSPAFLDWDRFSRLKNLLQTCAQDIKQWRVQQSATKTKYCYREPKLIVSALVLVPNGTVIVRFGICFRPKPRKWIRSLTRVQFSLLYANFFLKSLFMVEQRDKPKGYGEQ